MFFTAIKLVHVAVNMTTYAQDKAMDIALARVATVEEEKAAHASDIGPEDVIPGSEGVTQHDMDTLRHTADRLPFTAWLVVTVEFAER